VTAGEECWERKVNAEVKLILIQLRDTVAVRFQNISACKECQEMKECVWSNWT